MIMFAMNDIGLKNMNNNDCIASSFVVLKSRVVKKNKRNERTSEIKFPVPR